MIAIVSPAKTLDFETETSYQHSLPRFQSEALQLINVLKEKSEGDIKKLMSISDKLATLNVERYHSFTKKKDPAQSKQAIFAFQGDVYQGLKADTFNEKDLEFAQEHFRILSGLYGLLRPLDLIQPYRLEMGTKLEVNDSSNLYKFWEDKIVNQLNKDLKAQGDKYLINLASNEYFKAVDKKKLKAKVIDIDFLDFSSGKYKVIAFYAKKARGMMSHFILKNKIEDPEHLKAFDYDGYLYDDNASNENKLVFKRG
ncbi:MAG: peroxide stress protein YaaA [Candidatus Cyclobacteriaceae bacterium M2_1C_046]